MKVTNIQEFKENKEGRHTVAFVLEEVTKTIDEIEDIIIITRTKDREMEVSYSHQPTLQMVGMLEAAKNFVLNSAFEEE